MVEGNLPANGKLRDFALRFSTGQMPDAEVKSSLESLTLLEIASLKSDPSFRSLIDGLILKKALSGQKITPSLRWAINFLVGTDKEEAAQEPKRLREIRKGAIAVTPLD